jgi:hypothetical protein
MRPRAIEIRIGELVLEGFSASDRLRIGAAVERELARLVAERGMASALASGRERAIVDAGTFAHSPHATPAATGAHVARAVYRGLVR